jgi:hypothetical protein
LYKGIAMVSLDIIITIIILAFDFIISLWDAYASGYNICLIKKQDRQGFEKIASYAGLGLAFVGITYVLIIIISFVAYFLGYVTIGVVTIALNYNFLIFGLLIIGFGIVVTIQSILQAIQRKKPMDIIIAIFNSLMIVYDIYIYASGFEQAMSTIKTATRYEDESVVVIFLASITIAFFLVYATYKEGYKKASEKLDSKKQQ